MEMAVGGKYSKGMKAGLAIGVIISLYLTYVHFHPAALYCSNRGIIDCATVLGSRFSMVFGIPLSVYGVVWFLGALAFSSARGPARNIWAIGGIGGVAYSMAAMSVIGKICIYCAGVDTLILFYVVYSIFGGGSPTTDNT